MAKRLHMSADLTRRIADQITDEDVAAIIATMRAALKAETTIRSPRDPGDPTGYTLVPDWTNRIAAARFMWEMRDGKAKQSVDLSVAEGQRPMTRAEAARALLNDWDELRRIGDEHVRLLKQAIPAEHLAIDAQTTPVQVVDVDV